MDLSVFLQPVQKTEFQPQLEIKNGLINHVQFYEGEEQLQKKEYTLGIIGVTESRNAFENIGCDKGPHAFRNQFYKLQKHSADCKIIDLGNILPGNTFSDTYFALQQVCEHLMKMEIIPVIIGGGQDLTYPAYLAYQNLEQTINLTTIDRKLDFGAAEENHSECYLNDIVLHQPNFLFNFSNLGNQRPYVDEELMELMDKMYFDLHRLGALAGNIQHAEPVLRNADIVSFDLSSIRKGAGFMNSHCGPNGFSAHEACQLSWYAGMSDKLSSIGFYELDPTLDSTGGASTLLAEMIWYFIEGVNSRKNDYPYCSIEEYLKYTVSLEEHDIVFYKSNRSDRWWMDVPYPAGKKNLYDRHHIVPCTYSDYQTATNEQIPDLWWRTYQKVT